MLVNVLIWGSGYKMTGDGRRPLIPGMIVWERVDKKPEKKTREHLYFKLEDMDEKTLAEKIQIEKKLYKDNKKMLEYLNKNEYRSKAIEFAESKSEKTERNDDTGSDGDKGEQNTGVIRTSYNRLKKSDLQKLLKQNKIEFDKSANKNSLVELCFKKQLEV